MFGCTDSVKDYYNEKYCFIDTIGFDDPRFKKEQLYSNIYDIIKTCSYGINGVLFCFRYGKANQDLRKNIDIIYKLFYGTNIKDNILLIITHDEKKNNGYEWLLEQIMNDDKDALELVKNSKKKVLFVGQWYGIMMLIKTIIVMKIKENRFYIN